MCNNALKYNAPDTIYHRSAQKLLDWGLRFLEKQQITVDPDLPDTDSFTQDIILPNRFNDGAEQNPSTTSSSSLTGEQSGKLEKKQKKIGRPKKEDQMRGKRRYFEDGSLEWEGDLVHLVLPPLQFPFHYATHPKPAAYTDADDPFDERMPCKLRFRYDIPIVMPVRSFLFQLSITSIFINLCAFIYTL
jgi:hypothetical protein